MLLRTRGTATAAAAAPEGAADLGPPQAPAPPAQPIAATRTRERTRRAGTHRDYRNWTLQRPERHRTLLEWLRRNERRGQRTGWRRRASSTARACGSDACRWFTWCAASTPRRGGGPPRSA